MSVRAEEQKHLRRQPCHLPSNAVRTVRTTFESAGGRNTSVLNAQTAPDDRPVSTDSKRNTSLGSGAVGGQPSHTGVVSWGDRSGRVCYYGICESGVRVVRELCARPFRVGWYLARSQHPFLRNFILERTVFLPRRRDQGRPRGSTSRLHRSRTSLDSSAWRGSLVNLFHGVRAEEAKSNSRRHNS